MLSKIDFDNIVTGVKEKLDDQTQAVVSEDLLNIMSNYGLGLDEVSKKDEEIRKLKKDNDELLKVNGKLFQKIGFENKTEESKGFIPENKPKDKMKIEELINEKGEII